MGVREQFTPFFQDADLDRVVGEDGVQFLLPSRDEMRRRHHDRSIRLAGRVGMDRTRTHLRLACVVVNDASQFVSVVLFYREIVVEILT